MVSDNSSSVVCFFFFKFPKPLEVVSTDAQAFEIVTVQVITIDVTTEVATTEVATIEVVLIFF